MKPIVAMAIERIAGRWQVCVGRGASRWVSLAEDTRHFDTFDAALTYADSLRGQGGDEPEAEPS